MAGTRSRTPARASSRAGARKAEAAGSAGHRYVALLRGINVGTAKRVGMSDLRAIVESLGYKDVRTLLNSGNVVFEGPSAAPAAIAARIERAFQARVGFASRVTVLEGSELEAVVKGNPLLDVGVNHSRLMVAVLHDPEHAARLKPLTRERWGKEAVALGARVAYLWCPDGVITSPLFAAVSRVIGDGMTTRNWATMMKLSGLMRP